MNQRVANESNQGFISWLMTEEKKLKSVND
jgi:hypothetical protein